MATAANPESARRVIEAWISTEVLAAQVVRDGWNGFAKEKQGQQRNRATGQEDGPAFWRAPCEAAPAPWSSRDPPLAQASEANEESHSWYSVVLGALPARGAFRRLDEAFEDETDEDRVDRRLKGDIIAATVVLDEAGIMVPGTLAIASFAWGLGRVLLEGSAAELSVWGEEESRLTHRFADRLAPTAADGRPRPLTWSDLLSISMELQSELGIEPELWMPIPCAVRILRKEPPEKDILSSFYLDDLNRVRHDVSRLPPAAAGYLGLSVSSDPWDPLTDRARLRELLYPRLFPLGRWPGPGRHPLTLLQQAAVNATVRDLAVVGIAAVNGPPGTGKTTLLRDLVAHVMASRAEALARIDDPRKDALDVDLMDYAIVVASMNNAAVENVSLELPLRGKGLADDLWHDRELEYFARTADHVLEVPEEAPAADHAWSLIAARLGKMENRAIFFSRMWWDRDWGLRRWLDIAAFPDHQTELPSVLARLDPPPRPLDALAEWRGARDRFRQARRRCDYLRSELDAFDQATASVRDAEAKLPAAAKTALTALADLEAANRAVATAERDREESRTQEGIEAAKLKALHALAPSLLTRLLRRAAWRVHADLVRSQLARLEEAQAARKAAAARLGAARAEQDRVRKLHERASRERNRLAAVVAEARARSGRAREATGGAVPGPGFWLQPEADLQRSSPWNGGEFREARDALFVAAVALHKAFVAAAAKRVKDAVHIVAGGGSGMPQPSDWGMFFLLVPVVSTTFASLGRMFPSLDAASLGWVLVDEAGQAPPQAALGALWRARRAVVIGDPLQIEPIPPTPERTTRRLFEASGADVALWAAPEQSAQTLADRASAIQGRFRTMGGAGTRVTGIPLLVHRRCDRPMFELANRIAYDGRMVFATSPGPSPIRDVLGPTAWIDVSGPSSDKWVAREGEVVAEAMAKLGLELDGPPDLYVICPFRNPARQLRLLLDEKGTVVLPGLSRKERRAWIKRRVGTIHTFQGKEAEAVILMLGAGIGAPAGARTWAGRTPNLLNVAATRARRALYLVGNRDLWQGAGVFAEAATAFPVLAPDAWLGPARRCQGAAYQRVNR